MLIPHAGNIKNIMSRIAVWKPAEPSSLPVCATRLARNIQLQEAITNWKIPGVAIFTIDLITGKSIFQCEAWILSVAASV